MNENKKKKGFLGTVERVGNALPHPAIIFLLFVECQLCKGINTGQFIFSRSVIS